MKKIDHLLNIAWKLHEKEEQTIETENRKKQLALTRVVCAVIYTQTIVISQCTVIDNIFAKKWNKKKLKRIAFPHSR